MNIWMLPLVIFKLCNVFSGLCHCSSSCLSVISAVTAITQSAWVPTTLLDPPRRRESGYENLHCPFILLFALTRLALCSHITSPFVHTHSYETISILIMSLSHHPRLLNCFCTSFMCSFFYRCAPNVCVVRVVEPLNLGSPGMPSGHMTSPCVMTVPNSLLKVSNKHIESKMLFI